MLRELFFIVMKMLKIIPIVSTIRFEIIRNHAYGIRVSFRENIFIFLHTQSLHSIVLH